MDKYKRAEGQTVPTASTGTMWAVSGAFSVIAAAVTILGAITLFDSYIAIFFTFLVLAVVYTVSGINIRKRVDVSLPKLIFWQAGGPITVIFGFIMTDILLLGVLVNWELWITNYFITMHIIGWLNEWWTVCLPALQISWLIQAVIGRAGKKVNTPDQVTEEKIAE